MVENPPDTWKTEVRFFLGLFIFIFIFLKAIISTVERRSYMPLMSVRLAHRLFFYNKNLLNLREFYRL